MPETKPTTEVWFCWREFRPVRSAIEGVPDEPPRLLVPWADPHEYEFPMDWLFHTVEEAVRAKVDLAPEDDWVLVRLTMEPLAWEEESSAC